MNKQIDLPKTLTIDELFILIQIAVGNKPRKSDLNNERLETLEDNQLIQESIEAKEVYVYTLTDRGQTHIDKLVNLTLPEKIEVWQ